VETIKAVIWIVRKVKIRNGKVTKRKGGVVVIGMRVGINEIVTTTKKMSKKISAIREINMMERRIIQSIKSLVKARKGLVISVIVLKNTGIKIDEIVRFVRQAMGLIMIWSNKNMRTV